MFTFSVLMFTRQPNGVNKENTMQEMDYFHSAILQGFWKGYEACDIAEQLGADPIIVARIMDDFESMGY